MSLLPLEMLAPVVALGRSASSAAAAVGTGFAGMLKTAMQQATAAADESAKGDAGTQSTGSASPVGSGPSPSAVSALRNQTDAQIQSFHRQLLQLLAASGVDLSSEVHLQIDDFGDVRVAGDHPQKQQIEMILISHPELEQQFRGIAARSIALDNFEQSKVGLIPDMGERRFDLALNALAATGSIVAVSE